MARTLRPISDSFLTKLAMQQQLLRTGKNCDFSQANYRVNPLCLDRCRCVAAWWESEFQPVSPSPVDQSFGAESL